MVKVLLELYNALPVDQRGAALAAFIGSVGVIARALFTLFTALTNSLSVVMTNFMTARHARTQWRRERLWNAHLEALNNLIAHINASNRSYVLDALDYCELIDQALRLKLGARYEHATKVVFLDHDPSVSRIPMSNLLQLKRELDKKIYDYVQEGFVLNQEVYAVGDFDKTFLVVNSFGSSRSQYFAFLIESIHDLTTRYKSLLDKDAAQVTDGEIAGIRTTMQRLIEELEGDGARYREYQDKSILLRKTISGVINRL